MLKFIYKSRYFLACMQFKRFFKSSFSGKGVLAYFITIIFILFLKMNHLIKQPFVLIQMGQF